MNNTMFTTLLAAATRRNAPEPSPVRNGLVFWLDALNNTGHGLDTSATTWADLAGGNDLPIDLDCVAWQDNMCLQTADNYSAARSPNAIFTENGSYSFEAAVKFLPNVLSWIAIVAEGTTNYVQVYVSSGNKIALRCGSDAAALTTASSTAMVHATLDIATGLVTLYVNGRYGTSFTAVAPSRPIGGFFRAFSQTSPALYSRAGSGIYAVHIYDRALSAAEVAENYAYVSGKYGI